MAGFTTHYIFGADMICKLKDMPIYDLIMKYRKVYNLGLQGPDIFFYNVLLSRESSKYKFGKIMHKYDTNIFFSNAIEYISSLDSKKNKHRILKDTEYNKEVLSVYLYGLLAHYSLDTRVHPYVYSRASYSPEKDNADETFGMHSLVEINVDKKYLISRKRIIPSKFYQHKTVTISKKEKIAITDFLTYCIIRTYYREKLSDYKFNKFVSVHVKFTINIYKFLLFVLHDKHGYKRKTMQLFEKYILGHVALSNIILTDNLSDNIDSMNMHHKEWHHPWNQAVSSTESFCELYEKAGNYYIRLVEEIVKAEGDSFIKNSLKNHILELINDKSYHSGIKSGKHIISITRGI